MKPQFSIFSVFAVTVYVAIAVIGVLEPLSPWSNAIFPLWVFLVVRGLAKIGDAKSGTSPFASGYVLTCGLFVAAEMLASFPSRFVMGLLQASGVVGPFEISDIAHQYRDLLLAHGSLWLACLGGIAMRRWQQARLASPTLEEQNA